MPLYAFLCTACGLQSDYFEPVGTGFKACIACGAVMTRQWTMPTVQVHRSASDVLNRAVAGEGDPMPGKTMAETQQAAQQMATSHRQRRPRQPDVRKPSKPTIVYT